MSSSRVLSFVYKKADLQTLKAIGNWWRIQSHLWLDLDNMTPLYLNIGKYTALVKHAFCFYITPSKMMICEMLFICMYVYVSE